MCIILLRIFLFFIHVAHTYIKRQRRTAWTFEWTILSSFLRTKKIVSKKVKEADDGMTMGQEERKRKKYRKYEYLDFIAFVACLSILSFYMNIINVLILKSHLMSRQSGRTYYTTLFLSCRHSHSVSRNFWVSESASARKKKTVPLLYGHSLARSPNLHNILDKVIVVVGSSRV